MSRVGAAAAGAGGASAGALGVGLIVLPLAAFVVVASLVGPLFEARPLTALAVSHVVV